MVCRIKSISKTKEFRQPGRSDAVERPLRSHGRIVDTECILRTLAVRLRTGFVPAYFPYGPSCQTVSHRQCHLQARQDIKLDFLQTASLAFVYTDVTISCIQYTTIDRQRVGRMSEEHIIASLSPKKDAIERVSELLLLPL